MAKSETIQVRVRPQAKNEAERVFSSLGMTMSEAVNLFLHQVVLRRGLPFDVVLPREEGLSRDVLPLSTIREALSSTTAAYPAIEEAVLFGSYARGEATPESDVDVKIRIDRNAKFSFIDLSEYRADLERALAKSVDVVSADALGEGAFARSVQQDGMVVYER